MANQLILSTTALLLALFLGSNAAGSYPPKKVHIHVPHHHHHHTHTKYHFITVPLVRAANKTDPTPSPRTPMILPVMPVIPMVAGIMPPATNASTPAAQQPGFPQQPAFPQQPNAAQQPNFQQQPGQGQQPVFQQQPGQGQQPVFQQQPGQGQQPGFQQQPLQPNFQQQPGQQPFNANAMLLNADYQFVDAISRRSRDKVNRADLPPLPPMKFKTIINVQETKKIPILDLFDFLKREPPRRVKVDLYPGKASHVKQMKKFSEDWHALQDSIKANPYPGLNTHNLESGLHMDKLEYDPETATFQSRQEPVVERPEWTTLKRLLEKHIHEDFPGLKVKAEVKTVNGDHKERGDPKPAILDTTEAANMDLKHIGYIVIGDNNEQKFVGLGDASQT